APVRLLELSWSKRPTRVRRLRQPLPIGGADSRSNTANSSVSRRHRGLASPIMSCERSPRYASRACFELCCPWGQGRRSRAAHSSAVRLVCELFVTSAAGARREDVAHRAHRDFIEREPGGHEVFGVD